MNVDRYSSSSSFDMSPMTESSHTSNSIITDDGRVRFRFQRQSSVRNNHDLKRVESRRAVVPVVKKPAVVDPEAPPQVEIFPGFSARLRGAEETRACIEDGFYMPVSCLSCTLEVCCILDADFVICPCCQGITPVHADPTGEGGVGLGCTLDDVQKHIDALTRPTIVTQEAIVTPPTTTTTTTTTPTPPAKRKTPARAPSVSLYDIFPPHIAEALRDGRAVQAEEKELVTIFFSDIVGFTDISSTLEPRKIANMLDRFYNKLDDLTMQFDLYKIETIGDAFMAATNLVKDQSHDHCKRVAQFALKAIEAANETLIDLDDPSKGYIDIRVGFHSGSVVADVVGSRNPRYCLFGDTVNVSARMESNSACNRINCSERSADILREQWPEAQLQDRGELSIKGKGDMRCFFVEAPQSEAQ